MMPPPLPPGPRPRQSDQEAARGPRLTQEELATRAGTTVGTVSRMEASKSAPAWATVMQITRALDVSLAELAHAVEKARL